PRPRRHAADLPRGDAARARPGAGEALDPAGALRHRRRLRLRGRLPRLRRGALRHRPHGARRRRHPRRLGLVRPRGRQGLDQHAGPAMSDDRREIHDLVLRYCRGIDRVDLDLVASCYHPGGIDHHTGFDGPVEEYVEWLRPLLARGSGGTHHMIGNHYSEVDGDHAVAETYAHATHWGGPDDPPRANFTTG